MFRWAKKNDLVDTDIMLNFALPSGGPARERTLNEDEARRVFRAAGAIRYPSSSFIQLLLLTGARRDEIRRLRWSEIVEDEIEGAVIDLPAERTKQGRTSGGRERYERGEDGKAGYRNGCRPGKMKTAEGAVDYSAPQVRDTPEPFCVERAGGAFGTHAGTRTAGGRALRARPVDARHRGHVHRRDGQTASVAGGGERDHREAVGRVRRLLQA
jgi:hypothetical protein